MVEASSSAAAGQGAASGQAMDRVVERRARWPRRVALAVALGGMAVAGGWRLLGQGGQRSLVVAGSHLTTGRVTRGQFDDIIDVRGRVAPLRTTFVDTPSGGQVDALLVEDGARVTQGQVLARLSNTSLQLDLISREAQITEQLNNLRSLELTQEQNRLVHEREMVELHYQVKRLTRQSSRTQELVDRGLSPRNELDDMKDELGYYKKRLEVQEDTWAAADRLQKAQLVQLRTASRQLEANLAIARKNLDSLTIVAPAAGLLTGFTLQPGQTLSPGERMGQIDDPDHSKIIADIDEFYLPRVEAGQEAAYPLGGESYPLRVAKIRPQVQNGQFQIELTFTGRAPADIRRGQTAQIHLELGQPTQALLVPNAAFYNDTGGGWVFVVSSDHTHAVRRTVRLGRRNPRSIEVLDGLSAGEEIVTSPYTNFLDMDRLELTR